MNETISVEELISIVEKSNLDQTIKSILIRDIKNEGVNEFLLEQVIAYCDNASSILQKRVKDEQRKNPA